MTLHCPQCGYDLRGRAGFDCPECGESYDAALLAETGNRTFTAKYLAWRLLAPSAAVVISAFPATVLRWAGADWKIVLASFAFAVLPCLGILLIFAWINAIELPSRYFLRRTLLHGSTPPSLLTSAAAAIGLFLIQLPIGLVALIVAGWLLDSVGTTFLTP